MSVSEHSSNAPAQNAVGEKPGKFPAALVVVLMILLVGLGLLIVQIRNSNAEQNSQPTLNFSLTTFDGETIQLSNFKGKVVILNFWASWCGPCRAEAPELEANWAHYQDRGDVVFIGIAYADTESQSRSFIEHYGVTYANGADINFEISDQFQVRGVPMTFILDRDLAIHQVIYAGVTRDQLTGIIDQILAKA